jgi:hypothetical protein
MLLACIIPVPKLEEKKIEGALLEGRVPIETAVEGEEIFAALLTVAVAKVCRLVHGDRNFLYHAAPNAWGER